jgi:rhodanese-related sulfurtransferase
MPQTIHRGIKALIDEANAEIETLSATEAIKAAQGDDVVIVDIRDPREIERDGRIPGAFSCTRGMLEFWIDPASPYAKPVFQQEKKFIFHCAGGMRSALAAENRAGHGIEAGRAYGRRLRGLARRRRSGREGRAKESERLSRMTIRHHPSCPALCRASTSWSQ